MARFLCGLGVDTGRGVRVRDAAGAVCVQTPRRAAERAGHAAVLELLRAEAAGGGDVAEVEAAGGGGVEDTRFEQTRAAR